MLTFFFLFHIVAAAVRAKGKGGTVFNKKFGRSNPQKRIVSGGAASRKPMTTTSTGTNTTSATTAATRNKVKPSIAKTTNINTSAGNPISSRGSRPLRDRDNTSVPVTKNIGPSQAEYDALQNKNMELTDRVKTLEDNLLALEEERDIAITELETERDFYFTKLRDVEVLLQIHQDLETGIPNVVAEELFKVLYATAGDHVSITDDGFVLTQDAAEVPVGDALTTP
jgi:hypothetical protein